MSVGVREFEKKRIKREIKRGGAVIFKYDVEFPYVTDDAAASEKYRSWARTVEKAVLAEGLHSAGRQYAALFRSGHFAPLSAEASCQVMYNLNGIMSAFDDIYIDRRNEGTRLHRASLTVDVGSRQMRLESLFAPGARWRELLLGEICGQIERERAGGALYFFDAEKRAERLVGAAGFYLADDGLVLYFQPEQIAGVSVGIPSFMVRYEKLASVLRLKL